MRVPFDGSHPITQRFGNKSKRYKSGFHNGTDWSMPIGTPIYAPFDGFISRVERYRLFDYGRAVYIRSSDGHFEVVLAHLSSIPESIKPLVVVREGSMVAQSGNTGNSTGPHLHVTLFQNGKLIDPVTLIGTLFDSLNVKEYTIQKGDTLSQIAQKLLGSTTKWKDIFEKNKDRIQNPNILQVGQKLRIN